MTIYDNCIMNGFRDGKDEGVLLDGGLRVRSTSSLEELIAADESVIREFEDRLDELRKERDVRVGLLRTIRAVLHARETLRDVGAGAPPRYEDVMKR